MSSDTTKLTVYLDIDGTILYDPGDGSGWDELDGQLIGYDLETLLEFVVAHCNPFWLSYRARLGKTTELEKRLFPHLPEVARKIPVAYWDSFKHEGIDLSRPFVWFDDDVERTDWGWLCKHQRQGSLVEMFSHSPENPARILAAIQARMEEL
jgi:hypothetical protein